MSADGRRTQQENAESEAHQEGSDKRSSHVHGLLFHFPDGIVEPSFLLFRWTEPRHLRNIHTFDAISVPYRRRSPESVY